MNGHPYEYTPSMVGMSVVQRHLSFKKCKVKMANVKATPLTYTVHGKCSGTICRQVAGLIGETHGQGTCPNALDQNCAVCGWLCWNVSGTSFLKECHVSWAPSANFSVAAKPSFGTFRRLLYFSAVVQHFPHS